MFKKGEIRRNPEKRNIVLLVANCKIRFWVAFLRILMLVVLSWRDKTLLVVHPFGCLRSASNCLVFVEVTESLSCAVRSDLFKLGLRCPGFCSTPRHVLF
jgi:hypothetical protein